MKQSVKFVLAGLTIAIFMGGVYGIWQLAFGVRPCVPFAQKDVPNENDGNWVPVGTRLLLPLKNSDVEFKRSEYYEHKTKKGLKLGVHSFYSKVVFKAWACNNSNRPADSTNPKDREDHVVAVLADDEQWYKTKPGVQQPQTEITEDNSLSVSIVDERGRTILVVRKPPHRPN